MASKTAPQVAENETEAFEIIELAIGDLETLTRAFEVIRDVCESRDGRELAISLNHSYEVIN